MCAIYFFELYYGLTGLDDISVKLLKLSLDVIDEILTFLLNMSLKNCEVEWK